MQAGWQIREIGINPDSLQPGYPNSDLPWSLDSNLEENHQDPNNPFADLYGSTKSDPNNWYDPWDHDYDPNPPDSLDPTGSLGHWDPAALRWVNDVPTTVEGTAAGADTAGLIDEWSPHLPTTRESSAATLLDDDSAGHTGNGFAGGETDAGMRGHDPISSSGSSPFGDFQEPRHEVEDRPPENNDFDSDLF